MSSMQLSTPQNIAYMRPELFDKNNIETIKKLWRPVLKKDGECRTYISECDLEIIKHPFPVCLIRNVAPEQLIIDVLKVKAKFLKKSNDLYQFQQSKDLSNYVHYDAIDRLFKFLSNNIRPWIEEVLVQSGLKEEISVSFSRYSYGDRLLCHDDKCEDRHIAFVWYLTEDWQGSDGGNLELFETDNSGNPINPVVSIAAEFNTLVLFEVTSTSFHQVTEVLSKNKKRLSVNGWFHKDNLPVSPEPSLSTLAMNTFSLHTESALDEFIFDKYLLLTNQLDIKNLFVSNSEIQLDDIFVPPILIEIEEELKNSEIIWTNTGPANIRNYEVADETTLPPVLAQIVTMMQSKMWLSFLRKLTGLDLVPVTNSDLSIWEKGKSAVCKVELQRWLPGSYTLIHDRDMEFHISGLDVFIRFPASDNFRDEDDPKGGHVVYIDKQSQDESCLLHLGYKKNSLGMVFREVETLRFTKYLDSSAESFYQIQCLYIPWSPPDDQPELRHIEDSEEGEEYEELYGEELLNVLGGVEVEEMGDGCESELIIKQEVNSEEENYEAEENSETEEIPEEIKTVKRKKPNNKTKKKIKKKS